MSGLWIGEFGEKKMKCSGIDAVYEDGRGRAKPSASIFSEKLDRSADFF
jgi:hypothetical protein